MSLLNGQEQHSLNFFNLYNKMILRWLVDIARDSALTMHIKMKKGGSQTMQEV